jgi:SAM-dependent methyltransferase
MEEAVSTWRKIWRPIFGAHRRDQLKRLFGAKEEVVSGQRWSRVVMDRECRKLIDSLNPPSLDALEISGDHWQSTGFKSYRSISYPEYDVCAGALPETFDLVIAEQVFEHLLWPYRAGKNIFQLLRPGGHFLISTPFLIRVHNFPVDCSRWTELGLKHFLAECGFPLENTQTASWGNRSCVIQNLDHFLISYKPASHSLENEPDYPYHVWALTKK